MKTHAEPTQEILDEFVGVSHGDLARVRELLQQYPQLVNAKAQWGETPIEAAAQVANKEIMKLLLDAGAPLDICTAAALGDVERVLSMMEENPDLKNATGAHGIPIMHYPVVTGNKDLANLLLERGADVNAGTGSNTALHGAAYFNQLEMARWLIEHGADVNAPDYEGKTPLARALESGNQAVAEVLREHGGTG